MDEKSDVSLMELEQKEVPRTEDTFSLQSVTEDEAVLGRDATKFFMNEEYHECLPILQELAEKRPNDARVLTNLAVCKFYATHDNNRTDELRNLLMKTHYTLYESYGGELEPDQLQEYCVLIYNLALNQLDLKQFASAEAILSKLSNNLSTTPTKDKNQAVSDLNFAMDQIQPLLITLNLYLKNPAKTLALISKAEPKIKQESDPAAQQRFFLCHALALVQSKAFKNFKRDLKPNGLSHVNQVTYEFIRANLEFAKGNARKAMKLLGIGIQLVCSTAAETTPDDSWVNYINSLYQNNLGCLHLIMKKPNLGVFYLNQASDSHSQALALMTKSCVNSALPMHFLLKMKRHEISYNSAMNLLHAGQPALAFKTFLAILNSFALMPNVWLRLAECCLNQSRKDENLVSKLYSNPPWIHAKKVVQSDLTYSPIVLDNSVAKKLETNKTLNPKLNLEFAVICLKCAEKLIAKSNFSSTSEVSNSSTSNTSSPTKNLQTRSHLISLSIWSNLSYIYLCKGEHQLALENAEKVLQFNSNFPPGYKFLCHLYAAEAHMKLGHVNESVLMLDPKKVHNFQDVSFSDTVTTNNGNGNNGGNNGGNGNNSGNNQTGSNENQEAVQQAIAKVMFQVNLAIAFIMREEVDKAEEMLEKIVAPKELSYKVLSLRLYLALSKGNVEKARELATKYFEQELALGF